MMDVTRNVIIDLMPLYQSGEASADTRRLVEAYLRQDPALGRLVQGAPDGLLPTEPVVDVSDAARRRALERTRQVLARRQALLAAAVLLTLLPWTFAFSGSGVITWVMWRDAPWMAAVSAASGAACWIAYFRLRQLLQVAGL